MKYLISSLNLIQSLGGCSIFGVGSTLSSFEIYCAISFVACRVSVEESAGNLMEFLLYIICFLVFVFSFCQEKYNNLKYADKTP